MKKFLATLLIFSFPLPGLAQTPVTEYIFNQMNPFLRPVDTDTGEIQYQGTNPLLGDVDISTGQLSNPPINPLLDSTAAGGPYFGGRLTGTFFCPCSASIILYIQDYVTGGVLPLVYGPGSNLLVGSPYGLYQLGSWVPGAGVCLIPVPHGCAVIPTAGLIGGGSPGFGTSN
jgi:hypothetical protein